MSDKRKTAVEYLKNNLPSLFQDDESGFYTTLFERAKALEREQIEEAYYEGKQNIPSKTPDEYYDQTYGKDND
jgi:hypothetical protein